MNVFLILSVMSTSPSPSPPPPSPPPPSPAMPPPYAPGQAPQSPPPVMPPSSSELSTGAIIGIAVGAAALVCVVFVCFYMYCRRKKASESELIVDEEINMVEDARIASAIPPTRDGFPDAGKPNGWDDNRVTIKPADPPVPEMADQPVSNAPMNRKNRLPPPRKPIVVNQEPPALPPPVNETPPQEPLGKKFANFPVTAVGTLAGIIINSKPAQKEESQTTALRPKK
ncbi:putative membrane protein [Emiliania huxleyi virus 18]|nr:putative membrane protein [Emiliania huxleyi virus 18]AHA55324.1 putative membrane protein [Emiliania huxleyi virus 156]